MSGRKRVEGRVIDRVKTVDAHVGGQTLRLIVDGVPHLSGRTMRDKRAWLRRRADGLRRALVLEPRGHADLVAAVLTEAVSPEAHAGILFMDGSGFPPISGHGIIAAATIAVARDLFVSRDAAGPSTRRFDIRSLGAGADVRIAFDTPAGVVHTVVHAEGQGSERRIHSVVFTNVPAFVHAAAHPVRVGTRELRVDIAFAGLFYAIVDTEATGVALRAERLSDLRRLGIELQSTLNSSAEFVHPVDPDAKGIAGVIFTGPPADPEAHLRSVVVSGTVVDRSPGGTATAAVMAVLDAMGLLADDHHFVHESITGTLFRGRAARHTLVGEIPAIVAEIEASAWITGEHVFWIDEDDPFKEGLQL